MVLPLGGCATDGGVGGTGISTLQGNLVDSGSGAASASAAARVEGVLVRLQGFPIQTLTGPDGWFRLEGQFSGPLTVEFVAPQEAPTAVPVFVPAGGEVTLVNVRLDHGLRQARPERIDIDFEAIAITDAVCEPAGFLMVRDRSLDPHEIRIALSGATKIEEDNPTGEKSPNCQTLRAQFTLRIQGTETEGGIAASRIRIIRRTPLGRGGQFGL